MIWRVDVQWSYQGLNFTCQRGAKCATEAQAVYLVLKSLRIERADSYTYMVKQAFDLSDFTEDAKGLPLVNCPGMLVWDAFDRGRQ